MAENVTHVPLCDMPGHTAVSPAPWHAKGQKIVTNIISIQKNRVAMDKTFALLSNFLQHVREKEPGVELFLLNRDDERFQFVTYEIYKDQLAVDLHLRTDHMRELLHAEEVHEVKRAENDIHHETLVAQIGPRIPL